MIASPVKNSEKVFRLRVGSVRRRDAGPECILPGKLLQFSLRQNRNGKFSNKSSGMDKSLQDII